VEVITMPKLTEILSVRVQPSTIQTLDELCTAQHRTRANLVRYLILREKHSRLPEVVTEAELADRITRDAMPPMVGDDDAV
jgi:hypothetical protein